MEYAVIRLGGKQFKVKEGDTFEIERQKDLKPEVLLYESSSGEVTLGTPVISDTKVILSSLGGVLGKKVRVGRFRAKSRHRRVHGHRQPLTVVRVDQISEAKPKVDKTEKIKKTKVVENKVEKKAAKKPAKPVKKVANKR